MKRIHRSVLGISMGLAGAGLVPVGLAGALVLGAGSAVSFAQPAAVDEVFVLVPQRRMLGSRVGVVTAVKSVRADVRIVGSVATTTLTMVVHNPTSSLAQARVVVPVPDGAAIML